MATAWIAALAPGLSTAVVNRGAGSEAVYLLLVVSALWLAVSAADHRGRPRAVRAGAAGLLVGLAYLTRPEGRFVAVPLGVAVVVLALRGAGDRRRRLLSTAGLAAAFAVPIVHDAAYLHRHAGAWQLSAKTQDASIEAWQAVARSDREARDSVLYALDETGLAFSAERTSLTRLARDNPGAYLGIVRTNVASLAEIVADPETGRVLSWLLLPLPWCCPRAGLPGAGRLVAPGRPQRPAGGGRVDRGPHRPRRPGDEPQHGGRVLRRAAHDGDPLGRPRRDPGLWPPLRGAVHRGRLVHGSPAAP